MTLSASPQRRHAQATLHAILTDLQLWVPLGALGIGVGLLLWLH